MSIPGQGYLVKKQFFDERHSYVTEGDQVKQNDFDFESDQLLDKVFRRRLLVGDYDETEVLGVSMFIVD